MIKGTEKTDEDTHRVKSSGRVPHAGACVSMLLGYTSLLAHDVCVHNLEALNFFILAFLWKLHDMDKIDPSFSL